MPPPTHHALQVLEAEMGHSHGSLHLVLQGGGQRERRLCGRTLSSDNDRIGTVESAPPLTPGSRRERPADRARGFGADDRDIEVASYIESLVRIVQHQYLRAPRERPVCTH